jgi:hypothetical protein
MKKTALALTLVLTMILVGVQAVNVTEANMYPPSGVPALHVNSPKSTLASRQSQQSLSHLTIMFSRVLHR